MQALVAGMYAISNLTNLSGYIYVTSVIDIFFISVLLYIAIVLFKRARSYFVIVGIGLLSLLYGLAILLNLYLTTLALQAFFAVILIVVVVLFQEELRRFFERVASLGTRLQPGRQPIKKTKTTRIEEMVRALSQLSQRRVGALVVFPGEESVDRHVRGGRLIDAVISEELLLSLFDPGSPGHDGAILVDDQRIVRFGVHLPLSEQMDRVAKLGTRHTAAIGLTERADALVVVVSEETGDISVALSGELQKVEPTQLGEILSQFFTQHDTKTFGGLKSLATKHWREKALSLGIATFLWLLIAFPAGTVQRDFVVPISYENLPKDLLIVEALPSEITVALAGRGRAPFESITDQSIQVVIDGRDLTDGENSILLTEQLIKRPANISVVNMHPNVIDVLVERVEQLDIVVQPTISGVPGEGFIVEDVISTPKTISLLVPLGGLIPDFIPTQAVDVSGLIKDKTETALIEPPSGTLLALPEQAQVSVTVRIIRAEEKL